MQLKELTCKTFDKNSNQNSKYQSRNMLCCGRRKVRKLFYVNFIENNRVTLNQLPLNSKGGELHFFKNISRTDR